MTIRGAGAGVPETSESVEDAILMRAVARGETEPFAVLVRRHGSRLYRIALRMTGDGSEAEDIVQECFTRLWQAAPGWQPRGAGLAGWLCRVTMNLCRDRHRRLRIVADGAIPERADDQPLADRQIELVEAQQALLRALADLPERYRGALVLCYYEGLSNVMAADILDLSVKALESLLVRARKQLRTLLEREQYRIRHVRTEVGEEAA
ncbi:RNA polymerase sigma factor [Novosphingobium piscinae]|uniref:RNA polymerase sigma factor n=1 Tax=Novosphingobium piscinae TaxID=1507448 RepID=A0A7X1KNV2_9SPHN|nr:RNA polymerase sigma factor [Novosphingobium piscinae]MBC2667828.1 RNA polymerase sigma factor [Novosphingobium piscinae]